MTQPKLTVSHVTLSGAGFAQLPRFTFADRCRAAADAGFTAIGLHTSDPVLAEGTDGVRRALADSGLALGEIELLAGWARGTDAVDADIVDVLVDLAREFSPHHVTAGEFGAEPVDPRKAAGVLRGLADRFGEHGTLVAVEQFPWSGLRLTSTVAAVLDACGPGVGAMLDVWHHRNSGATRGDLDLLTERIVAVQLNDGLRVTGDFLAHARAARRLPGDGELDVAGLVSDLLTIGFDGPWCVESSDETLRSDPLELSARRAHNAAVAVLED